MLMERPDFFLLNLLVLAIFLQANTAKGQRICSSSCGEIRNISYPFRLQDAPRDCGDQKHDLSCENNRTILYLQSVRYFVQEIFYHNRTLRVVDSNLDRNKCSLPLNSLYMQPYISLSYSNDPCVIFFVSCTTPVNSSLFVDASPCVENSSFSIPTKYFYALFGDFKPSNLPNLCKIEAFISIRTCNITGMSVLDIYQEILLGFDFGYYSEPIQVPVFERLFDAIKDSRYIILTFIGLFYIGRCILGFPFLVAILIYRCSRRHLSMDDTVEEFLESQNNFMPIRYSYSQIKKMTSGFQHKLGQGGFGSVYKGRLRSGQLVAVKVLGISKGSGQDFMNEVATIGRVHHVNVVQLIGFCAEGSKRALIFDFMAKGSLDKYIFSDRETNSSSHPLSTEKMYEISLGVAKGIEYLHQGCDMQILHFDIKPHNILLNDHFIPKVSDFGLAKLYSVDDSIVSLTAARGTLGYIAPELFYKNIGGISYKADVYSFGMLLMEMVGRRKNFNVHAENSSQKYFPSWIYNRYCEAEDVEFGDINENEKKIARKMVIVALWCIQMSPSSRPSMRNVLDMLEGEVEILEIPPEPFVRHPEMSTQNTGGKGENIPLLSAGATMSFTLDVR